MAQKFKVGQMVEDFEKGVGVVTQIYIGVEPPVSVEFESGLSDKYTIEGQRWRWQKLKPVLRLTGRTFNVGDKVVVGGEKGEITSTTTGGINPLKVITDNGFTYLTTDGRAWPGTPIICEHDWEEEAETIAEKTVTIKDVKWFICDMNGTIIDNSLELPSEYVDLYQRQCRSMNRYTFRFEGYAYNTEAAPQKVATTKESL